MAPTGAQALLGAWRAPRARAIVSKPTHATHRRRTATPATLVLPFRSEPFVGSPSASFVRRDFFCEGSNMRNTSVNGGATRSSMTTGVPRLLAAAPIISISDELGRHVEDLRRLAPASDATTALTLYRDKLTQAIQKARHLELFVTAEQAAIVLGKSVSMITYLCRTGALAAKKVGGTWHIDRVDLERMRAIDQEEKRAG
ncbi:MAG: helix-turn-helix domain-containing protein [Gemmatimonas sp.]|nr:helix-turn-helix domain-containing protein [Gemmatimonas sp.]